MRRPSVCLTVPFFTPEEQERKDEIYSTLKKNIQKSYIDKILLLIDDNSFKSARDMPEKVECIYLDARPTYEDWLVFIKDSEDEYDYQIMANADIEIQDNMKDLLPAEMAGEKIFLAISRYDINYEIGSLSLRKNPHWTQDTWCLKASDLKYLEPRLLRACSIPVGTPRCDNKIAYEFWLRGWKIINPCRRIITKHHQKSDLRAYQKNDTTILGSVLFPHPSRALGKSGKNEISIFTLGKTVDTAISISDYLLEPFKDQNQNFAESACWHHKDNIAAYPQKLKRFNVRELNGKLIELRDMMFPGTIYQGMSVREILLDNIDEIYSKVQIICNRYMHSGDKEGLFWQYPAITEQDAYERHLKQNKISTINNDRVILYFPFPWATFIDMGSDVNEATYLIAKRFINGLKDFLIQNQISIEIHTVCQHIRWKDSLLFIKAMGVTDLHSSHSMGPEYMRDDVKIHPWVLYAPNIEDPERRAGLSDKPLLTRHYLASFIGAYMDHYINDDRKLLADIKSSNVFIKVIDKWHLNDDVYKYQVQKSKVPAEFADEQIKKIIHYNQLLSDSKFSLCPIGAGPNTLRFWESIAMGSIPVLFNRKFSPPFFQEFNAKKQSDLKYSDIFSYVDLERENPSSFLKELEKYSNFELEQRSQLCKEYYSFCQDKLCLSVNSDQSKAEIKKFEVDFYRWPNQSFPFRLYFDHPNLRVFIIENIMHNWDWLSQVANHITDKDFFYVYCGWYHDIYFAQTYSRILSELGLRQKQFFIMFNSQEEKRIFNEYGFYGEVINHNCWLDWNQSMRILADTDKLFDAIYVGRRSAFKRHMLANKVPNLAIIAGNNHGNKISEVPCSEYINEKPLTPEDVCEKINQSNCGLILSKLEGACFSSSEYLLCGIPVVSTKCKGGRDFWYNSYNSIVVDADEDSVANAVLHFKNSPLNPEKIRSDHIALSLQQRNIFITHLQSLFEQNGIGLSAGEYFRDNYIHKLRTAQRIDKVIQHWI